MEGLLFVISIEFLIGEACPCWSVNMNNCACGLTLVFETSIGLERVIYFVKRRE